MLTNERELSWTPAQYAYSAWLEAASETRQGPAAVIRAMQKFLTANELLDGLAPKWKVGGTVGNDFNQWRKGRKPSWKPTTPDNDALQQALIAVVSDAVPQPPERIQRLGLDPDGRWDTFSTVFWAVHDAKDASLTSTAKQAAAGAHSEARARKARDLTATEPVSAAELDPKALNLGSWMFDGGVPPYVARTADIQLAERLTANATGLTVVVGPPKSGKSRSVLETLAGAVPDATVQWVNPAPGVLPALVDLHWKEKNAGPGVVVLDDAQFLGVNPMDGLTAQRLTELASRSRLIVIVHEQDLGMWRNQINNR
ncbi:hypothetical protein MTX38_32330, partial [Rhodococcus sp. ARC_M13]|uniref:hypothetical protein n=1 Tax=Rhodococcus sp. ARC_M13 TaxID=2928855 RepID=UPI001FB22082